MGTLYQQLLSNRQAAQRRAVHAAIQSRDLQDEAFDLVGAALAAAGAEPADFDLAYGVGVFDPALGISVTPRDFVWRLGEWRSVHFAGRHAPLLVLRRLSLAAGAEWNWSVCDQHGYTLVPMDGRCDRRAWAIGQIKTMLTDPDNFYGRQQLAALPAGGLVRVEIDWRRHNLAPVQIVAEADWIDERAWQRAEAREVGQPDVLDLLDFVPALAAVD